MANAIASTLDSTYLPSNASHTIVIIDSNVTGYPFLANNVIEGADVHILDSQRDGITQITEILQSLREQQTQNCDPDRFSHPASSYVLPPISLHLVAHGAPGTLYIGNTQLNLGTLTHYTNQLQNWRIEHFLLYGCQVAMGDAGAEFLRKLHTLTQAKIAASSTPVGHISQGGNWNLDRTTHPVSFSPAFKGDVKNWQGILATINSSGGVAADGSDGLKIDINTDTALQINYRGSQQFYEPADIFVAVGDVLIGASGSRSWVAQSQSAVTGSGTTANPFQVVTSVYDDANSNSTYDANSEIKLNYTVSYVSGDAFLSQTYGLIVPATNTNVIKLYHIGDTLLLGGDEGPAYGLNASGNLITSTADNPALIGTIKNQGQPDESFLAFVESGREWDFWYSAYYDDPYGQIANGGNLVTTYDTDPTTDNGIGVQYTLGAITGSSTISNKLTFSSSAIQDVLDLPGFTIANVGNTALSETGTTSSFTVVLDAKPTSNVVLLVNSGDSGEASTNPVKLTFTPLNWDTPQTVTVTGIDDDVVDGTQTSVVALSIDAANSNDVYDGLAAQTVTFTTLDDDVAGVMGTPTPDIVFKRGGKSQIIQGSQDDDYIRGNPFQNKVIGRGGNDRLFGGRYNRWGLGKDLIYGGAGDDYLNGGRGRDLLDGEAGNDRILGKQGKDILIGGAGKDTLTGGQAKDMFGYEQVSEGGDRITDFNPAVDVFDLRQIFARNSFQGGSDFSRFTQFIKFQQVGSTTQVKIDADGKGTGTTFVTLATLQGVAKNELSASNFVIS